MSNWIPVSSGLFPDDKVEVQVTYIGTNDQKPYCSAFAHRDNGEWHWTEDESDVRVTITAWKENCEPYVEEVSVPVQQKLCKTIKTVRCHYAYLADYCNKISRDHIISITSAFGEQYGEHFFTIVYDTPGLELKDC